MNKQRTNITIDPELKKQAVKLFNNFGLDLSSAITLFLQQAVREQRIPFEIRLEIPNDETLEAFAEFEEMKRNPEKYKRYSSFKELLEEIKNEENNQE